MRPDPPAERLRRRATDRVERAVAWLLGAAAIVLLVVALVIGVGVHGRQAERAVDESATRTKVTAMVLEDVQVVTGENGPTPERAMAQWTAPNGMAVTGRVMVRTPVRAGDRVDVWIDREGRVTAPPARPANAVFAGVMAVVGVLIFGGGALAGLWFGLLRVTAACNMRRWEQEWAQVGPVWTRDLR